MATHALKIIQHLTMCIGARNGTFNEVLFQAFIVAKKLSQ